MNPSFTEIKLDNGDLWKDGDISVHGLRSGHFYFDEGTYFAFVAKGIVWHNSDTPIKKGMYGCFTSGYLQADRDAMVLIVRHRTYNGMRMFGGPVEQVGRLKYIDGCTDSLLIPPVKLGDPCLNHLHFPTGINQTMHTHPSVRIGMVYRGHGACITPWGNERLTEGYAFIIHPENGKEHEGHPVGSHCFMTGDRTMDIIAFHPDSDFGPTDQEHPMLNRTIVDGVSAKHLTDIQTK
jgi:hypothetical protein